MARIKYIGPGEVRIPGVGPVTNEFIPCSQEVAEEFEDEEGFVVELETSLKTPSPEPPLTDHPSPYPLPLRGEDKKSKSEIRTPKSAIEKPGGDQS